MALRAADDELVVGASSFEDLYRTYATRVRSVLLNRFRRDTSRVDDLVQEVFLRAYRARDAIEEGRDPWPWLCTIAVNLAIDEQRRPQREYSAELLSARSTDGDPWEYYESAERSAAFKAAVGSLPARSRRLVLLKDAAGYDYDELAEADGTTVQALRCAVLRARRRLRDSYSAELASRGLAAITAPFSRLLYGRVASFQEKMRRTTEAGVMTGVATSSGLAALVVGVAGLLPLSAPAAPAFHSPTRLASTVSVIAPHSTASPTAAHGDPLPARPAGTTTPTSNPAGRGGGVVRPPTVNAGFDPDGRPRYGVTAYVGAWAVAMTDHDYSVQCQKSGMKCAEANPSSALPNPAP